MVDASARCSILPLQRAHGSHLFDKRGFGEQDDRLQVMKHVLKGLYMRRSKLVTIDEPIDIQTFKELLIFCDEHYMTVDEFIIQALEYMKELGVRR